jgi:hypothetical protein
MTAEVQLQKIMFTILKALDTKKNGLAVNRQL